MKIRKIIVAAVVVAFGVCNAPYPGHAQTVTSDPIQTTPGYPGCGGNTQIQDVTADYTCGNQRTFHLGTLTRTVIAISTFHANGTASTTFTLTGGNAPLNLNLRIVSHSGVSSSSGPVIDEVTGVMPQGTKGPVTLSYRFDCGQIDIKAILTGNGDSAGRISGPYLCVVAPATTTTIAPGSTAPATSSPGITPAPSTAPSTGGPGASAQARVVALPATGSESRPAVFYGVLAFVLGTALVIITRARRRIHS